MNDDSFALFTISTTLGFHDKIGKIDKATNGQEAFEFVRDNERPDNQERAYDMIFLDLEMPIKNGFEACAMIKKHYKSINEEQEIKSLSEGENGKDSKVKSNYTPEWLDDL